MRTPRIKLESEDTFRYLPRKKEHFPQSTQKCVKLRQIVRTFHKKTKDDVKKIQTRIRGKPDRDRDRDRDRTGPRVKKTRIPV
jgi:hypothetical protein